MSNKKQSAVTPELEKAGHRDLSVSPTQYMPTQEDFDSFISPLLTQHPTTSTSSTFHEYPLTQYTPSDSNDEKEGSNKKQKTTETTIKKDEEDTETDSTTEKESERNAKIKRFLSKACSINFAMVCPHCDNTICDGTTLTSFIYERLDINEISDYDEALDTFQETYLILKDYELFQNSRYANPDIISPFVKLPKCVVKTFDQYYIDRMDHGSAFNQSRRKLKIMNEKS